MKTNHDVFFNPDLRWNNAGLIGGRALVDLMRWNMVLEDIPLTGNEVPEDLSSAICKSFTSTHKPALFSNPHKPAPTVTSLERNRTRHIQEQTTRIQSNHYSQTIQTITQTHHEALQTLSSKLASTDSHAQSLQQRLASASREIAESQDAYRMIEAKYARMAKEKDEMESILTRERTDSRRLISELQGQLLAEREVRMIVGRLTTFVGNESRELT